MKARVFVFSDDSSQRFVGNKKIDPVGRAVLVLQPCCKAGVIFKRVALIRRRIAERWKEHKAVQTLHTVNVAYLIFLRKILAVELS